MKVAHARCQTGPSHLHQKDIFATTHGSPVFFQLATMGSKATPSSLGHWIRACIAKAYKLQSLPLPRHIMAHSTRSLAMFVAWATQASIEEVCRATTWASRPHLSIIASWTVTPRRRLPLADEFSNGSTLRRELRPGQQPTHKDKPGFGMYHSWMLFPPTMENEYWSYLRRPLSGQRR